MYRPFSSDEAAKRAGLLRRFGCTMPKAGLCIHWDVGYAAAIEQINEEVRRVTKEFWSKREPLKDPSLDWVRRMGEMSIRWREEGVMK